MESSLIWSKAAAAQLTGGFLTFVPALRAKVSTTPRTGRRTRPTNPVPWCAAAEPDGTWTMQMANRRRYAVAVAAPGGTIRALSSNLAAQLSAASFLDGSSMVLGPGDVADVTFPAGASPGLTIQYDGFAQSITGLLVAAQVLARDRASIGVRGPRPPTSSSRSWAPGASRRSRPPSAVTSSAPTPSLGCCSNASIRRPSGGGRSSG